MKKNCLLCNNEFKTKPSHYEMRKYCSKKCMDVARQTFELRNCVICFTQFKYYVSRGPVGKFCSLQCKGINMRHPRDPKACIVCNKEFICDIKYKKKKFCSIECRAKSMIGSERPSFWETAPIEKQLERLKKAYEKYVVRNEHGCWGWKGSLSKRYGNLQFGGKYKSISAHQGSYILHKGYIPKGMFVCHTCDNPSCTKPDHLFLGTPTDNVRDMIKKGRNRTPKGQDAKHSKLTNEQVISIKEEILNGATTGYLAQKYNISPATISDIKAKRTWKHMGELS